MLVGRGLLLLPDRVVAGYSSDNVGTSEFQRKIWICLERSCDNDVKVEFGFLGCFGHGHGLRVSSYPTVQIGLSAAFTTVRLLQW